jgi:hypothetical protein
MHGLALVHRFDGLNQIPYTRAHASKSPLDRALSRVTPAMEAGVSDHAWSLEEIIGLLEPSLI